MPWIVLNVPFDESVRSAKALQLVQNLWLSATINFFSDIDEPRHALMAMS